MGILKAVLIVLSIACLVFGSLPMSASARIEGQWALQVGDVITGEDFSIEHPTSQIFHQQTQTAIDRENLSINFPVFTDGVDLGPTAIDVGDAGATSNILPFGPVDLAFPSIHQDVDQSIETTSTGFFHANWAYMADVASGNLGSGPLGVSFSAIEPFKSKQLLGSEFIWPLMTPIGQASASSGSLMLDANDLMPGHSINNDMSDILNDAPFTDLLVDVPAYGAEKISFSGENASSKNSTAGTGNMTGVTAPGNNTVSRNNSTPQLPSGSSPRKPRIDPKSTREQIQNMTDMQRIYRNAFIGTTMYKAYEGPTQYPTWIDPFDNGRGVFNQIDMHKILQIALKKTQPGEHIAPVFWDL